MFGPRSYPEDACVVNSGPTGVARNLRYLPFRKYFITEKTLPIIPELENLSSKDFCHKLSTALKYLTMWSLMRIC